MHLHPRAHENPLWTAVKAYKSEVLIGLTAGVAIGCSTKYLAAAFLIFWILAGGK
jgi:hypothetical protein